MKRKATILLLTFWAVSNCFGQIGNSKKRIPNFYSNWISVDYLNCLKTDLPCECEKSKEYFLINLDTIKKYVLLYDGRANYDYHLFDIHIISPTNFEIYHKQYSQMLFRDTITVIGHIKIKCDTLFFKESSGKQSEFYHYNSGTNNNYFNENIELLNSALTARVYDKLNKILHSDSLKCFCNWELGGINLIFGNQGNWILEKKDNKLSIYKWTNPPTDKEDDLKIEKILLKRLNW